MPVTALSQFDGCRLNGVSLGGKNCLTTVGAMLVAFATGGKKRPTGCDVRSFCRNKSGTLDVTEGTYPAQVADAVKRGYGVRLDVQIMAFEEAWTLSGRDDTALGFSISYAPVSGTKFDGSPGFRGNHGVMRTAGLVYDPLADGRRPGIPKAPGNWPKAMVRRGSGLLSLGPPYGLLGDGRAYVLIAEAPAVAVQRWSAIFTPGQIWVYDVANHQITGRETDRGFTAKTSAPAEAAEAIPWTPGTRRRLMLLKKGRLAGRYVEPGSSHVEEEAA